jgi:hypothetical protein
MGQLHKRSKQAVGVERAVTRWYIRQQALQQEIATLQAHLAQLSLGGEKQAGAELAGIEQQLAEAHVRLQGLGPCPKPMMG